MSKFAGKSSVISKKEDFNGRFLLAQAHKQTTSAA
jgi:hypothetical protein